MAKCTAPKRGHQSAEAAAECPVCRYRAGYSGVSLSYAPANYVREIPHSNGGARPRWSKSGSSVFYTATQVHSLNPIRDTIEIRSVEQADLYDVFLCHAWDDRQGVAKKLSDLLVQTGVKVWFSEKDLPLGIPMMRAIDKGLANSKIGLVLVTPALLKRLPKESVSDKELSVLLNGNMLVPIVHETTYNDLRNVSPMLASRSGLDTAEDSIEIVAKKIAELVLI
jgi:TIR domain